MFSLANHKLASVLSLALPLALLGSYGCSAESTPPSSFSDHGTGGSSNGNLDGGLGDDADASDEDAPPVLMDAGPKKDGALTKDSACAAQHVEAETPTLDLYIMADKSGSMSGGGWSSQRSAMEAFFNSPEAKGVWVALNFFPYDGNSENDQCQGDEYVKPYQHGVDWGELPSHTPELMAAIDGTDPDGLTPTEDALNGALRGAMDRQLAYPDHVVAVVMISDGDPTECDESSSTLSNTASKYANGTPPIHTFAIYTKTSATAAMQAIATGGATGSAYSATNTQAFINALQTILHTMVGCEFKMPKAEAGIVDPDRVEVEISLQGGEPEHLDRIEAPDTCGVKQGWHYDNDDNPAKIILCPATCDLVKQDKTTKIDILLGCAQTQR